MVCMGYADDHAGDVYRMFNPDTGRVIESRDITWADWHGSQAIPKSLKMFADGQVFDTTDDYIGEEAPPPKPSPEPSPPIEILDNEEDEEDDSPAEAGRKDDDTPPENPPQVPPASTPRPNRLGRELAKLNTYYNPTTAGPQAATVEAPEVNNTEDGNMQEIFNVQLSSDPGEPKSFQKAITSSERKGDGSNQKQT